ncbi:MAG: hypothetical protein KAW93_02410, partial [Methanogenium sp.]|nr:hypothetical protein [Methanogenium sp.]
NDYFSASTSGTEISTNSDGTVADSCTISSKDKKGYIKIEKGTCALTKSGNPIDNVNIEPVESKDLPPIGSEGEYSFADYSYRCTPSGATFDPAIKLVFDVTEEDWNNISEEKAFVIRWFNSDTNSWDLVNTTIDSEKHTATAYISHFSIYALFEESIVKKVETDDEKTIKKSESPKTTENTAIDTVKASETEKPDEKTPATDQAKKSDGESLLLFAGILLLLGIAGCILYIPTLKNDKKGEDQK